MTARDGGDGAECGEEGVVELRMSIYTPSVSAAQDRDNREAEAQTDINGHA